jgi:hypothetical protein
MSSGNSFLPCQNLEKGTGIQVLGPQQRSSRPSQNATMLLQYLKGAIIWPSGFPAASPVLETTKTLTASDTRYTSLEFFLLIINAFHLMWIDIHVDLLALSAVNDGSGLWIRTEVTVLHQQAIPWWPSGCLVKQEALGAQVLNKIPGT